jgi:hypothetical protein
MAKQYYAVNKIKFGRGNDEPLIFEANQQVTGLPVEEMKVLWAAGVLREVDPDNVPPDARDEKIAALEAQIAQLEAEKAAAKEAAEAEPRPAEEVPGQGPLATPNSPEAAADMAGTSGAPTPPADNE